MNKTPDKAKMRREYLRKVAVADTLEMIGSGIALVFGFIVVFLTLILCLSLVLGEDGESLSLAGLVSFLIFMIPPGALAVGGLLLARAAARQARSIPYVPPVAEQIATLPAREILVRASDDPATLPDELLRAARLGAAEPAEELLRASVE